MTPQKQLLDELATLRNARGAAVLDGRRYDGRRLAQVEAELAGLEDAEAESTRRAHQAHEKAASERLKEAVQRIAELNSQRLAALERAEKAGREMVAALKDSNDASRGILDAAAGLDGVQAPFVLDQRPSERRLAQCVIALLQPLGHRSGFGDAKWFLPPTEAFGSWVEFDRKATGAIMRILTNEGGSCEQH